MRNSQTRPIRSRAAAGVAVVAAAVLFVGQPMVADAGGQLTGQDIQNDSIQSKDIKDDNLKSRDIRDGSLRAKDFKDGELPAGAEGAVGPQGSTGPVGPKGDQGANGNTGPRGTQGVPGPEGPEGPAGPRVLAAMFRSDTCSPPFAELATPNVTSTPGQVAGTCDVSWTGAGGWSVPVVSGGATWEVGLFGSLGTGEMTVDVGSSSYFTIMISAVNPSSPPARPGSITSRTLR